MFDEAEIAAVRAPLNQASTLPPGAYTRADVFDREVAALFRKEWVCVAREEQVPNPGDYRAVSVGCQPLIIARDKDGSIRAMSAICPHRGMPVATGEGNVTAFSCPYHLWKFALDGQLISAPLMDEVQDFPNDNCNLARVRLETWNGFVFVNLDADALPLNARLEGLVAIMDGYDMNDMQIVSSTKFESPWNWKILVENFMEAYHHIGPHNDSLQATYPAKRSSVSGSVVDGWSVLHMPTVSESGDDGLPPLPNLTERQQGEILASVIMPTFCWINTPSVAFWYQLNPRAADDFDLTIHALVHKDLASSELGAEIGPLVIEGVRHIHLEDIPVNEGPWTGVNAPLTRQGRLSLLEEAIWQCNNWWLNRVCA